MTRGSVSPSSWTRLRDAVFALADRADMLVCEATFANAEAGLARDLNRLPVPPRRPAPAG